MISAFVGVPRPERVRTLGFACVLACSLASCAAPWSARPPVVDANDNRVPAGALENGVLTLDLEVRMARWYPGAPDGPYTDVPVFAEVGHAPQIPAPLIRVPQGTRVRVRVANRVPDSTFTIDGLGRGEDGGDVRIASGARYEGEFATDAAGTRFYNVRSATLDAPRGPEISQLAGAIVVDAPGARTDDRILVMNIWSAQHPDSSWSEALAINGKSWPYTERFDFTVGDSVHWRVLNLTRRRHPMHLHGAFYRVDAVGDGAADTLYAPADRRMVVTEDMPPRSTMKLVWSPDEAGNWLFHCHLSFHVSAEAQLAPPEAHHDPSAPADIRDHMAGLVIGLTVHPRPGATAPTRPNARKVSVYVVPGVAKDSTHPANIAFIGARVGREPLPAEVRVPGEMLVLTRGEPTDVTVHNRLAENTAIHWHGLELESWSDGVPGWSGAGPRVAPAIAPGDSFTARLSLRRAGTFIYHTHLNDIDQLSAGLYGALIVLEPGQRWDPTHDILFVSGWNSAFGEEVAVVNGDTTEAPLQLRVGESYRLRFINIAPADHITYQLERGGALTSWQVIAKDGADLPPNQVVRGPATRGFSEGETFDVRFAPTMAGTYTLVAGRGRKRVPIYSRRFEVSR